MVPGLFPALRDQGIPFQYVPVEKLNRLTGKNHQGIIALVSELEYTELEKLIPLLFEQGKYRCWYCSIALPMCVI